MVRIKQGSRLLGIACLLFVFLAGCGRPEVVREARIWKEILIEELDSRLIPYELDSLSRAARRAVADASADIGAHGISFKSCDDSNEEAPAYLIRDGESIEFPVTQVGGCSADPSTSKYVISYNDHVMDEIHRRFGEDAKIRFRSRGTRLCGGVIILAHQ